MRSFSNRIAGAGCFAIVSSYAAARAYTWPDHQIDYLEEIRFEQTGFGTFSPANGIFPCNTLIAPTSDTGRIGSAEWIRTAYHDMATADVEAGLGGIDASIGFETQRRENAGAAFNDTIFFFRPFHSPRSSMSDIIAMGAILAAESCSGGAIHIPYRGGRVDATGPAPPGVPQPEENLDTHTKSFKKQGFNVTEMIGLVACGHAIGGVHGKDFPEIVPDLKDPKNSDSTHGFDLTIDKFDNKIATDFVNNGSQNPLAFGHNETTRSDFRIFNADGGNLIKRMAESEEYFFSVCTDLLERMVNTVPKSVKLTDIITPIPLKPRHIRLKFGLDGVNVTGSIRILEDGSTSRDRQVVVHLKPQPGSDAKEMAVQAPRVGEAHMFYTDRANFTFYDFSAAIPHSYGLSSFDVEVIDGSKQTVHTNGGKGYPLDDKIILQNELCCKHTEVIRDPFTVNTTVRAVAAIRDDMAFDDVQLIVYIPVSMPNTLTGQLRAQSIPMTKIGALNGTGYSQYSAQLSHFEIARAKETLDIVATGPKGRAELTFFDWGEVDAGFRDCEPRCPQLNIPSVTGETLPPEMCEGV